MSNTPKLSRIVLKQRRFESARGSKTSDSPEVLLAELANKCAGRLKILTNRLESTRFESIRFVFLKVDSTQQKSGRKVLQVLCRSEGFAHGMTRR